MPDCKHRCLSSCLRKQLYRGSRQQKNCKLVRSEVELVGAFSLSVGAVVLRNLLSDTKPASIHDLERLFHSCRLSSGVATETVAQLQRRWTATTAEAAQHRILSVLERLTQHKAVALTKRDRSRLRLWLQHVACSSPEVEWRIQSLEKDLIAANRRLASLNTGRLGTVFENIGMPH